MNPPNPASLPDFEALFEAAPGLLLAVRPDDAFTIAAASDTYLRATMTRREDIVGRPIFDVFPDNPDHPTTQGVEAVRAAFERARRERQQLVMPVYQHDLRRPEAGGGGFERRFWQTSVWPVPAGAASPSDVRYLLCRVEDVTARMESDRERADAHLRREATLAASEMGTWIWEVSANRVFADRNLARLFGVSQADADGGPVESYFHAIHPDDIAPIKEALDRALREGSGYAVEYRLARADGSYRWVAARGWAERDEAGNVQRFPGVVLDVTERKQAEQDLRENEERLRMAIDSARLGTFDFDPRAGVLTWSDACRAMFGVPPGAPVTYETTFAAALHPDDRARVQAAVDEAIRPGGGGRYNAEYRIRPLDGGEERWIAAAGQTFFNDQGLAQRFIGTVMDITVRKTAEQAAERRSEQLKKLAVIAGRLNAAHDVRSVLGILTEEARQLIGAHESITQAEADAHAPDGQPLTVVSRPHFDPADPPPEAIAAGGDAALCAPLIGRHGQRLGTIQLTNKHDHGFSPDDAALLAQLSQIAAGAIENARLYEELRGNDRRKDEFLAMLAHELRNPLSAILNAVALGSGEEVTTEDVSWSMEVIQRQLKQLTRLIDDLLDVSRITRGKVQLRKELLDVTHVLGRAVEAVRGLFDERRHDLAVDLRDDAMPLHADPTRLEQIFVNLLTNAARYTDHGGRIELSAGRENGHVVIRVKDNGLGIPPEKLPQMFELFAQGDRALARSEGGLGVGLTIVRSLTEMHGGTVQAHSEGQGKGSEFTVRLPVAAEELARTAATGTPETRPTVKVAAERVLVVDDNADSANGTARILSRHGYEVRVVYDGPSAVEIAPDYRPRFVLLDIGLPGMDGYEVAQRLRANRGLPGIRLIAVSGYGQESDRRRSFEAGFDHHLVKPVDPERLLALLREVG